MVKISDLTKKLDQQDSRVNDLLEKLDQRDTQVNDLLEKLDQRDSQISDLIKKLDQLNLAYQELRNSLGYAILMKVRSVLNMIFPPNTKRRNNLDKIVLKFGRWASQRVPATVEESEIETNFLKYSTLTLNEQYKLWLKNNSLTKNKIKMLEKKIETFKIKPKISIVMPVYNVERIWLKKCINSVRNQIYKNWELCIVDDASTKKHIKEILENFKAIDNRIKVKYLQKNQGIAGASNESLAMCTGDYMGLLDDDDELYPEALFEIVKRINQSTDADFLYTDEDKIDFDGQRIEPLFKPDWSPEFLMNCNYITHFCVLKKTLIKSLNGFRKGYDGSQDYDLFLRATEKTQNIEHIPKILYGWRKIPGSASSSIGAKPYAYKSAIRALEDTINRRGYDGTVEQIPETLFYRPKYTIGNPLVSIIIPTLDNFSNLIRCLSSIKKKTRYKNYEIIIVDYNNKKASPNLQLNLTNQKVVNFQGGDSFSKICNFGAKQAKGDYLLFLNDNTEIISKYWLNALLECAVPKQIGVVGGMLLNPKNFRRSSELIKHAGVILTIDGIATNAFHGRPINNTNYFNIHLALCNYSAVSSACMMIKKKIFEKVNGFDEQLQSKFSSIDLCLRIGSAGNTIVYTPYAKLYWHGPTKEKEITRQDELIFRKKWKQKLGKQDPYYNPNLSHINSNYNISPYSNLPLPIAMLMELYLDRNDLQAQFPEVKDGEYERILVWILKHAIKEDEFNFLRKFEQEFGDYLQLLHNKSRGTDKEYLENIII